MDAALREELLAIDTGLLAECDSFVSAVRQRALAIKDACEPEGAWESLSRAPASPSRKLKPLWEFMRLEAKALEAAADTGARAALEESFEQLDARVRLHELEAAVLDAIDKHEVQAVLQQCLGAVKTTGISNKAAELNKKVASQALEARLNAEFKKLNVGSLHVRLKPAPGRSPPTCERPSREPVWAAA